MEALEDLIVKCQRVSINMPVFNPFSAQNLFLLCLLYENESGPFKYFSFAPGTIASFANRGH